MSRDMEQALGALICGTIMVAVANLLAALLLY